MNRGTQHLYQAAFLCWLLPFVQVLTSCPSTIHPFFPILPPTTTHKIQFVQQPTVLQSQRFASIGRYWYKPISIVGVALQHSRLPLSFTHRYLLCFTSFTFVNPCSYTDVKYAALLVERSVLTPESITTRWAVPRCIRRGGREDLDTVKINTEQLPNLGGCGFQSARGRLLASLQWLLSSEMWKEHHHVGQAGAPHTLTSHTQELHSNNSTCATIGRTDSDYITVNHKWWSPPPPQPAGIFQSTGIGFSSGNTWTKPRGALRSLCINKAIMLPTRDPRTSHLTHASQPNSQMENGTVVLQAAENLSDTVQLKTNHMK